MEKSEVTTSEVYKLKSELASDRLKWHCYGGHDSFISAGAGSMLAAMLNNTIIDVKPEKLVPKKKVILKI